MKSLAYACFGLCGMAVLFGLYLIILSVQLFGFTLILELGRRCGFGRTRPGG